MVLNDILGQMDLINIYRTFHSKIAQYPFSRAYETFSRIDHMLGHKINLNKFKIEIIASTFSVYNTMRLEINYREKNCKNTYTSKIKKKKLS